MRAECSICYERTRDVGDLDGCVHRFCFPCISRWADTENRCPMCKERFTAITRRRLPKRRRPRDAPAIRGPYSTAGPGAEAGEPLPLGTSAADGGKGATGGSTLAAVAPSAAAAGGYGEGAAGGPPAKRRRRELQALLEAAAVTLPTRQDRTSMDGEAQGDEDGQRAGACPGRLPGANGSSGQGPQPHPGPPQAQAHGNGLLPDRAARRLALERLAQRRRQEQEQGQGQGQGGRQGRPAQDRLQARGQVPLRLTRRTAALLDERSAPARAAAPASASTLVGVAAAASAPSPAEAAPAGHQPRGAPCDADAIHRPSAAVTGAAATAEASDGTSSGFAGRAGYGSGTRAAAAAEERRVERVQGPPAEGWAGREVGLVVGEHLDREAEAGGYACHACSERPGQGQGVGVRREGLACREQPVTVSSGSGSESSTDGEEGDGWGDGEEEREEAGDVRGGGESGELQAAGAEGGGTRRRLCGVVVETRVVEDKKQYWEPPEAAHLNLDTLACELCGSGEDDAHLLICDGCDLGFHTYCVGLEQIPYEEWYCPSCEEQRVLLAVAAASGPNTVAVAGEALSLDGPPPGGGVGVGGAATGGLHGRGRRRRGRPRGRGRRPAARSPEHRPSDSHGDASEDENEEEEKEEEGAEGRVRGSGMGGRGRMGSLGRRRRRSPSGSRPTYRQHVSSSSSPSSSYSASGSDMEEYRSDDEVGVTRGGRYGGMDGRGWEGEVGQRGPGAHDSRSRRAQGQGQASRGRAPGRLVGPEQDPGGGRRRAAAGGGGGGEAAGLAPAPTRSVADEWIARLAARRAARLAAAQAAAAAEAATAEAAAAEAPQAGELAAVGLTAEPGGLAASGAAGTGSTALVEPDTASPALQPYAAGGNLAGRTGHAAGAGHLVVGGAMLCGPALGVAGGADGACVQCSSSVGNCMQLAGASTAAAAGGGGAAGDAEARVGMNACAAVMRCGIPQEPCDASPAAHAPQLPAACLNQRTRHSVSPEAPASTNDTGPGQPTGPSAFHAPILAPGTAPEPGTSLATDGPGIARAVPAIAAAAAAAGAGVAATAAATAAAVRPRPGRRLLGLGASWVATATAAPATSPATASPAAPACHGLAPAPAIARTSAPALPSPQVPPGNAAEAAVVGAAAAVAAPGDAAAAPVAHAADAAPSVALAAIPAAAGPGAAAAGSSAAGPAAAAAQSAPTAAAATAAAAAMTASAAAAAAAAGAQRPGGRLLGLGASWMGPRGAGSLGGGGRVCPAAGSGAGRGSVRGR